MVSSASNYRPGRSKNSYPTLHQVRRSLFVHPCPINTCTWSSHSLGLFELDNHVAVVVATCTNCCALVASTTKPHPHCIRLGWSNKYPTTLTLFSLLLFSITVCPLATIVQSQIHHINQPQLWEKDPMLKRINVPVKMR